MNIVQRLRKRNTPYGWTELADKAADEIERLQKENKRLWGELFNAEFEDWRRKYKKEDLPTWQEMRGILKDDNK